MVTYSDASNSFGMSLIRGLFWYLWLVPILAGIFGVVPALIKVNLASLLCWIVATLLCCLCIYGFYFTINECNVSASVLEVKHVMSFEETESITLYRKICPNGFKYVSSKTGKQVHVIGLEDLVHGTKISIDEQGY